MSVNSSNERQRGMTLLEVLIVIAMMALITGLVYTSPLFSSRIAAMNRNVKQDFHSWYQLMGQRALYGSSIGRVCLIENRMVLQRYDREAGWRDSDVMYIPPHGVTLTTQSQACSPLLNNENDEFVSQVHFE